MYMLTESDIFICINDEPFKLLELKNRFALLWDIESEEGFAVGENSEDKKCGLGKVERRGCTDGRGGAGNRKEAWISKATWKAIDERRKCKQKMEQAGEQGAGYEVAAAEQTLR